MDKLDQLKDIKPIETIQIDFSVYFIAITLLVLLLSVALYFITNRKKKKMDKKRFAKQYLKSLDLNNNDPKKLAYDFTLYGYDCVQEHYKDEFEKIVAQLEPYKYKKDVPNIDDHLLHEMKDYIKVRV